MVDKDSGLFFWFNCKDESSQWADTEGEGWAGYGSRRASTMAPASAFSNTLMDAALGGSTKSQEAPKSPRAPTRADEKETDAKNAAEDSKAEGIASTGIAGIAAAEEEDEAAAQSKKESEPDSDSKTEPITPAAVSAQASLRDAKEGEEAPAAEAKAEDKPESKDESAPAVAAASGEIAPAEVAEAKDEGPKADAVEKAEEPAAVDVKEDAPAAEPAAEAAPAPAE